MILSGEVQSVAIVNNKIITMDCNVTSATQAKCLTPLIKTSSDATFALSFSKKAWSKSAVRKLKNFKVKIIAAAPKLLSAKMKDNYREIDLEFDSAVWSSTKSCKNMFADSTIELFGEPLSFIYFDKKLADQNLYLIIFVI